MDGHGRAGAALARRPRADARGGFPPRRRPQYGARCGGGRGDRRPAPAGTAGFGATIDLDGFEPGDAPGIGLKTENGLRREEMLQALAGLGRRPDLAAIEIVEYIPELDERQRTAHLVRDLLIAILRP